MKKILSYLFVLALLFSACNPMEDINKEVDSKTITNVNKDLEIVLTDADYEAMGGDVASNYAFSANAAAKDYIPIYLKALHPVLTSGSVAKVTYNYYMGYPNLNEYKNAEKYTLTESDYNSVSETVGSAGYFSPGNAADDYLPAILDNAIPDTTVGTHIVVNYQYFKQDPDPNQVGGTTLLDETFDENLGDFQTINVTGDQDWYASGYGGDGFAKMNGYSGGAQENEDWLITPQIDLTGDYSEALLNFTQTANYLYGQWDQLSVLISEDYDGADPSSATWTELSANNLPTGDNYDFVNSGDINLSSYLGSKIYIGFRYISTTSNAATWEITDVKITAGVSVNTTTVDEFYTFTSSGWTKSTDAYYVKAEDYNAMGGSLAKYHDFSSSDNPDNYLPQMLELKFPYAQEGTTMAIIYKYYSGGLKTYADQYSIVNGTWTKYDPIIVKTDQFILGSNDEWVFDPTVNYTMVSDDYQIIVDYVKANIGAEYVSSYGNNEYYYGANAYYTEFQIGDSYYETSVFSSWQDAITEAIGKGFLPGKYPNAVTQVDGIDIYYVVTFTTYLSGTVKNYTIKFQCTKSSPNPEFTYIEGPTLVE